METEPEWGWEPWCGRTLPSFRALPADSGDSFRSHRRVTTSPERSPAEFSCGIMLGTRSPSRNVRTHSRLMWLLSKGTPDLSVYG